MIVKEKVMSQHLHRQNKNKQKRISVNVTQIGKTVLGRIIARAKQLVEVVDYKRCFSLSVSSLFTLLPISLMLVYKALPTRCHNFI